MLRRRLGLGLLIACGCPSPAVEPESELAHRPTLSSIPASPEPPPTEPAAKPGPSPHPSSKPPPAEPSAKPRPSPRPSAESPRSGRDDETTEPPGTTATLLRVTDGDTIQVRMAGKKEKVRLIGIDTPETEHSPRGPQPYADEATAAVRRLLGRGSLTLRFDAEERDHYGRLLAYVYAADGTFVNEAMIRDGWARPLRVPPNVRHAEHFDRLSRQARRAGRGMWR